MVINDRIVGTVIFLLGVLLMLGIGFATIQYEGFIDDSPSTMFLILLNIGLLATGAAMSDFGSNKLMERRNENKRTTTNAAKL